MDDLSIFAFFPRKRSQSAGPSKLLEREKTTVSALETQPPPPPPESGSGPTLSLATVAKVVAPKKAALLEAEAELEVVLVRERERGETSWIGIHTIHAIRLIMYVIYGCICTYVM